MGNKKWILYNNVERKRLGQVKWTITNPIPKAGLHPKKLMFCVWWDWKGVLCYGLLLENQTIPTSTALDQLKAALDKKCPELGNRKCIIFHQDNARPCFSDDQAQTVTAWLGSASSSAVFTRHYAFGFPFILVFTKFSHLKKFHFPERL